jgi:flagellar motor component MotA
MNTVNLGTRIVSGILFTGMFLAAIVMGSPLTSFINLPSVIIVIGGGSLLWTLSHGLSGPVHMFQRALGPANPVELEEAQIIADTGRRQFERVGWLGVLIGCIQMLQNMDDPKMIGPAMALALLTAFYGHLIAAVVFLPFSRHFAARLQRLHITGP